MYARILVPTDLAHLETLEKAMKTAGALAKHFGATVRYVGVTGEPPSAVASTPQGYETALERFAAEQAQTHGVTTEAKTYVAHDPSTDLNDVLLQAIDEAGADLVVMGSHAPQFADLIWPSHGGTVAKRSTASVFVVR